MASAAPFPSLAAYVQDSPARAAYRPGSPAGDSCRSVFLRQVEVPAAVARRPSSSARSSVNSGVEGFARIPAVGVDSLMKLRKGQAASLEANAIIKFLRDPFVRNLHPEQAELFWLGNASASADIMRKMEDGKSCGWTWLHSRCSNEHIGMWFRSLYMMQGIASRGFLIEGALATIAWTFVMPYEALAETCESNSGSLANMPLLFTIALIGATVGGLLARQRRGELARVNDQLRQINAALRRQAKIESYAPNLSYAPISRVAENDIIVDPKKQEVISTLKSGKNYLRHQNPGKAFDEFKTALELARNLRDPVEEKKAARGLGAALQRQGKFREAIKYHSMVLSISKRTGEDSGNTEAYGAIADCYTELGDLERAGRFYDQYISRLEKD
ncbi:protein FLUORESCENT IN BLUE LIGHT, chloroplastic isoform X1 [Nymphaea colorata]|nr:protein FLUORESCENT IN BLUE LIGHT, chloroplastic isoform X1 [Nymphaea colorata]